MYYRSKRFLVSLVATLIALGAFAVTSYAQVTMSISGPCSAPAAITSPASDQAPSDCFKVTASVTGSPTSVVIYRNAVPYETFGSSGPYYIIQEALGQDTYTYRARAYYSATPPKDSADVTMTVQTPNVFSMGDTIPGESSPTHGPIRNSTDHTDEIKRAIAYLSTFPDGGTLFFPCKIPNGQSQAYYSIRETIDVPGNITLQSEGSEQYGNCRIYWHDPQWTPTPYPTPAPSPVPTPTPLPECHDNEGTNYPLTHKPMFRVQAGAERVRFRDMWLYSRSSGDNCFPRMIEFDRERIATEGTVAIELNTEYVPACETSICGPDEGADIKDVIFENVSITSFTYGIKAVSEIEKGEDTSEHEISNVKIRGYKAEGNFRQLYINSKYAYNWDIQNLNITGMMKLQGGVDIVRAGYPERYNGPNPGIKFTHLNCNGNQDRENPPAFCVQVQKHGGLYFRQLHHEGVPTALTVQDISGLHDNTNPDPIILEASVASGDFHDASMQLYLIGNSISTPETVAYGLDDSRLRFIDSGVNANIVDCGDVHFDWTDGRGPGQSTKPEYEDLKMLFSHAERNRASFFAKFTSYDDEYMMPHTYCPADIGGVGGLFFDNGVLPTEGAVTSPDMKYSNYFIPTCGLGSPAACLQSLMTKGGVVYIPGSETSYSIGQKVDVPRGVIVVGQTHANGTPLAELSLTAAQAASLFQIDIPITPAGDRRISGTVIRNLKLSATSRIATVGISMNGLPCYPVSPRTTCDPGVSSDFHLSGISFQGFDMGLYAGRASGSNSANPMIDGVSVKNVSFTDNNTAVRIDSSNLSNWNVMDVDMSANLSTAYGWDQTYGGFVGLQDVKCKGTSSNALDECIRLQMSSIFLAGLRTTEFVDNALTIGTNGSVQSAEYQTKFPSNLVLRNNDFSSGSTNSVVNVVGKAYITSMNNNYTNFSVVSSHGGNISRLTWCDDIYPSTTDPTTDPYGSGLEVNMDRNYWVGVPTATRVHCSSRPMPFDDAVRWGDNLDVVPTGISTDVPLIGNFYDNVIDDFVFYRDGATTNAQSYFHIKRAGVPNEKMVVPWGIKDDIPFVGNFVGTKSQVAIWRPSTRDWWITDPNNPSAPPIVVNFGLAGDIPLVGNFFNEAGSADKDEVAIYRPGTVPVFWVINPITLETRTHTRSANFGTEFQVGDFVGAGHEQVAQFQAGTWNIIDLDTGTLDTAYLGTTGDKPVGGKFLPPSSGSAPQCAQLGVWSPADQKFYVLDGDAACGSRPVQSMLWGSNNDYYGSTLYKDDIPFAMTGAGGLSRPTVYRPTRAIFTQSIANGQWWVHDKF